MPSYVGIGTSITHNVEVDGNLFLQDIEGGPDSTRVPLEIFSNLVSSSVESANSRMLRLRVNNYGETDVSNSYVTDMGIRGDPGKDYFFITAPQNTSNVGDQNTFVISTTSNVGIGTTEPRETPACRGRLLDHWNLDRIQHHRCLTRHHQLQPGDGLGVHTDRGGH
jgi:hypothetical protein